MGNKQINNRFGMGFNSNLQMQFTGSLSHPSLIAAFTQQNGIPKILIYKVSWTKGVLKPVDQEKMNKLTAVELERKQKKLAFVLEGIEKTNQQRTAFLSPEAAQHLRENKKELTLDGRKTEVVELSQEDFETLVKMAESIIQQFEQSQVAKPKDEHHAMRESTASRQGIEMPVITIGELDLEMEKDMADAQQKLLDKWLQNIEDEKVANEKAAERKDRESQDLKDQIKRDDVKKTEIKREIGKKEIEKGKGH